jgi:hypothetical protein
VEYLSNFLANEKTFKKLSDVLRVFNEKGIKAMLLKGSHLAPFVYQDIGLRTMCDIDILVKKQDLPRVEELLLKAGYKHYTITNSVEWYKTNHFHLPFTHPEGIKHLEIHWTIVTQHSLFAPDIEGIWERAKMETFFGTDTLVLSAEDLLLHLCFHIAHDDIFRCGARSFCDISAALIHYNQDIDWNQLQNRAFKWGFEKYLYITLHLSREILGASVPDTVLLALKPEKFNEKISLEARNRIFSRETGKPVIVDVAHMEKLHPDISLSKKISNIFHEIFIPPEEMVARYRLPPSSRRVYFYYFVRFFSFLYRKAPLYASFFLHLLTRSKIDFYNHNLESWLISSIKEEKIKKK